MLHVSALFKPSSGIHFKNYCFSVLSYSFSAIALGIPFCIRNHNYCLYGVRCPLLFVNGGGGFSVGSFSFTFTLFNKFSEPFYGGEVTRRTNRILEYL